MGSRPSVGPDVVARVWKLRREGMSAVKIARHSGVSYQTVYRILKGKLRQRTTDARHRCIEFVPTCPDCQMQRAFFLLTRARLEVKDRLLLHDIEDALLQWPSPVVEAEDPVDRTGPVAVPDPTPGLGSEKDQKQLLTA